LRSFVQKWVAVVMVAAGVAFVSVPAALVVAGLIVLADAVTPAKGS
jgi:hypothetical protein